jgi:hypothetical protein
MNPEILLGLALALTSLPLGAAEPAGELDSADCATAIEQVLEQTAGQLLSVRRRATGCTITLLLRGPDKRPQRKTIRVPLSYPPVSVDTVGDRSD